jgi:hypothetical protein
MAKEISEPKEAPLLKVPQTPQTQPLDHISYSSVLLFLANPAAWYSKYRLGIRDQLSNPAAVVGKAFHKYLELRFKGSPLKPASEVAETEVLTTTDVDWGKTGSPEKAIDDLRKLIQGFHEYPPSIGEVVGVEQYCYKKVKGLKLPIKAYIDLIHRQPDGLHLVDWKTVRAFDDEPSPSHIIQACTYYWLTDNPIDFTIFQVKASANKDGSPQTRALTISYADHPEYLLATKDLFKQVLREMTKKKANYLFNPRDDFEGAAEFKRYVNQFIK